MISSPRYLLSDLYFESDRPLPELQPADSGTFGETEVWIRWMATRETAAPGARFSEWRTDEGSEWLTFADVAAGYLLTFPEHGQFEMSRDASTVSVHPFRATPPETMRHLLLNQILPLVISRRGRLVLHASAISYGHRVVAFTGRSGGGKSTLAAACAVAGAAIVSDDCLVIRRNPDGWVAVPCQAGVRLWPDSLKLFGWPAESGHSALQYTDKRRFDDRHQGLAFEMRTLPLAAILYLPPMSIGESPTSTLGPAAVARPLRGRDAVMALSSEMFRLDTRDADESRRLFDQVGQLAAEVPAEIVTRQAPDQAARALLCRMADSWRHSRD